MAHDHVGHGRISRAPEGVLGRVSERGDRAACAPKRPVGRSLSVRAPLRPLSAPRAAEAVTASLPGASKIRQDGKLFGRSGHRGLLLFVSESRQVRRPPRSSFESTSTVSMQSLPIDLADSRVRRSSMVRIAAGWSTRDSALLHRSIAHRPTIRQAAAPRSHPNRRPPGDPSQPRLRGLQNSTSESGRARRGRNTSSPAPCVDRQHRILGDRGPSLAVRVTLKASQALPQDCGLSSGHPGSARAATSAAAGPRDPAIPPNFVRFPWSHCRARPRSEGGQKEWPRV